MRAITGAIVSSEPCLLRKAYRIINFFCNSAASDLLSDDCAAYLSTVNQAIADHEWYRGRLLRGTQQQGANNIEAHDYEGEVKHQGRERKGDITGSQSQRDSAAEVEPDLAAGEKKSKKKKNKEDHHQDRERKGDIAGSQSQRDSAAEVEPVIAGGEKKSKKKKNKEDRQEGGAVAGVESRIPSSPRTSREKKEKHPIKEVVISAKQEPDLVADEELLNEKKSKKKMEKGRVKLEVEEGDADEVGGKIVKDGWLH
ncbi:unnamed protein product [Urochloa humidicola]